VEVCRELTHAEKIYRNLAESQSKVIAEQVEYIKSLESKLGEALHNMKGLQNQVTMAANAPF
jgi:uncharacterized protein involved in exopolysaccharide biosynthesis